MSKIFDISSSQTVDLSNLGTIIRERREALGLTQSRLAQLSGLSRQTLVGLEAGDVVQGSGGVRKVRWARAGTGKSGGVRVCYYTRNAAGKILLLVIYAKSVRASIPGAVLKQIKEVLEHDD